MRQTLGEVLGTSVTDVSRAVDGGAGAEITLLDSAPLRAESASFALDLNVDMAPSPSGDGSCLYASPAVPASRRRTSDYRSVAHVKVTLGRQPVPGPIRMIVKATGRMTRADLESGRQFRRDLSKEKLVAEFAGRFDCDWVDLESAFVDDGPRRTLVLVWHANLCSDFVSSPALVKFSKSKYAIARAKKLKLATANYYRNYEGTEPGIRDEMEARQIAKLSTVLNGRRSAVPFSRVVSPAGEATYGTDSTWLFCTAIRPAWDTDLRRLQQQFSAESATVISNPLRFATQLGKRFAGNLPRTRLSNMDGLRLSCYRKHQIDNVVQVFHGPVLYTDDQELAFSQPSHLRGIASCFSKGRSFDWQREYRFVVSTVGEPAEDELLLPISERMRGLAETGPWG